MEGFLQRVLRGMLYAASRLPLGIHYFQARILAFAIEKIVRYRVDLVDENLTKAFPDKDILWVKKNRHRFYLHLANIVHEALWFGGCRDGREIIRQSGKLGRFRKSRLVSIRNPEVLGSLWEKCPSVIIMSSHCGNWELSGCPPFCNYLPVDDHISEKSLVVVHLQQKDSFWNGFLKHNRTAILADPEGYPGYIESRQVLRYIMTHRDRKLFYNFITDQRPYFDLQNQKRVKFMDRECFTMTGSADVAHKLGLGVVYQRMAVNENGKGYTLEYETICEDASKMEPMDIIRRYYSLLEADLRAQPFNYLWTHNRWWIPE